jgi:hypothetical protein
MLNQNGGFPLILAAIGQTPRADLELEIASFTIRAIRAIRGQ